MSGTDRTDIVDEFVEMQQQPMNEADHAESRAALQPNDVRDAKLLANVRPPDWTNPPPAPSYNLVVLGAEGGRAGRGDQPGGAGAKDDEGVAGGGLRVRPVRWSHVGQQLGVADVVRL